MPCSVHLLVLVLEDYDSADFNGWQLGVMVSVVGHINEVAVRRVRLVLGWVTVFGGLSSLVSLPSHLGQLSLLPSVGRENE